MIKSICLSVVSIIAITYTAFGDKKIPPTFAKAPDHEDFAKKLFSAALPGDENENFVISPYGAFQAFSLISLGAKGKTSQAFNITLGYDTNAPFKTVDVALPKFEISSRVDLINPLSKMGLGIAFSYLADFSRISDTSLAISKAEQVAKIRVDEDGTEAAAATYIAMMRCAR